MDLTLPTVIGVDGLCRTVVYQEDGVLALSEKGPYAVDTVLLTPTEEEHLRNILNARAIAAVEALKPKRPPYGTVLRRDQVLDGEYYSHDNTSLVWRAGGAPPPDMPSGASPATWRGWPAWTFDSKLVVLRSPEDFK